MNSVRKVAAHEIRFADGRSLKPGIVEIVDGMVRKFYMFHDEQAQTEWLGGIIEIKQEGENLIAYKNNKPI